MTKNQTAKRLETTNKPIKWTASFCDTDGHCINTEEVTVRNVCDMAQVTDQFGDTYYLPIRDVTWAIAMDWTITITL